MASFNKTGETGYAVGMTLTLSVSFLLILYYGFYLFLTKRQ